MTKSLKFCFATAAATILTAGVIALFVVTFQPTETKASASDFLERCNPTAPATTTLSFMSAGAGTTTLTCYIAPTTGLAADTAKLLVQFTGSSTPLSLLNISYEYSQDGVDWYSDTLSRGATTTQTASLNQATVQQLNMASTTVGGAAGISARAMRIVDVPTPTRWVRAVFTIPVGSQPGALWASFVGKREI